MTLTTNDYIKAASIFTDNKSTMPVIGCIALNSSIRATDLETSYEASVDAPASLHGLLHSNQVKALLSGATIPLCADALKGFPSGLKVVFPHGLETASISSDVLVTLLKRMLQTVSPEYTRPTLCGVYFDGSDIVSTDGKRLTRIKTECLAPIGKQIILGTDAIKKLIKWIGARKGETVAIALGSSVCVTENNRPLPDGATFAEPKINHLRFVIGCEAVTCRLVDGQFPDYRRVIPESVNREYSIPIATLRRVFESQIKPALASRKSPESRHVVQFSFDGSASNSIAIRYRNPDSNVTIDTDLACAGDRSDPSDNFLLGLNAWYVLDVLSGIPKSFAGSVNLQLDVEVPDSLDDVEVIDSLDDTVNKPDEVLSPITIVYCDSETVVIMPMSLK